MVLIFRHFAILVIAVVLVNAAIARARIPNLFAAGGMDAVEAERFVWFAAAWLIAFFALNEVLTVTSGASSPLCFIPASHPSGTWQYLAWTLWIAWVLGVTAWVWIGNGGERAARVRPLLRDRCRGGQHSNGPAVHLG